MTNANFDSKIRNSKFVILRYLYKQEIIVTLHIHYQFVLNNDLFHIQNI